MPVRSFLAEQAHWKSFDGQSLPSQTVEPCHTQLRPLCFAGFVKRRNRQNIGLEWHAIFSTTWLVWAFEKCRILCMRLEWMEIFLWKLVQMNSKKKFLWIVSYESNNLHRKKILLIRILQNSFRNPLNQRGDWGIIVLNKGFHRKKLPSRVYLVAGCLISLILHFLEFICTSLFDS